MFWSSPVLEPTRVLPPGQPWELFIWLGNSWPKMNISRMNWEVLPSRMIFPYFLGCIDLYNPTHTYTVVDPNCIIQWFVVPQPRGSPFFLTLLRRTCRIRQGPPTNSRFQRRNPTASLQGNFTAGSMVSFGYKNTAFLSLLNFHAMNLLQECTGKQWFLLDFILIYLKFLKYDAAHPVAFAMGLCWHPSF